jgi:hypothetical protein
VLSHTDDAESDLEGPALLREVRARRALRTAGLSTGVLFGVMAGGLGISSGILDKTLCLTLLSTGCLAWLGVTLTYEESGSPLSDDHFNVQEVPGKGRGLICAQPIAAGTYLFDYGGQRLSEEAFFQRFPSGQSDYAARITSTEYIDGASEGSGLAPMMNHACERATVRKATQIFGPNTAIHFYARRDLMPGEELTWNYGAEYWDAQPELPIDT